VYVSFCILDRCSRADHHTLFHQVFIQVQTDEEETLFAPQVATIVALSKGCKSAKVVRDIGDIPAGCGSAVVTPSIIVHTLVRVRVFVVNMHTTSLICV